LTISYLTKFRVELHTTSLQQLEEFLIKLHLSVMCLLILYVSLDRGDDRSAYGECSVTFLPDKSVAFILSCGARPRAMHGSDARVLWNAPPVLFGRVARSWTIASAILFIVLAVGTGLASLGTYASSFP